MRSLSLLAVCTLATLFAAGCHPFEDLSQYQLPELDDAGKLDADAALDVPEVDAPDRDELDLDIPDDDAPDDVVPELDGSDLGESSDDDVPDLAESDATEDDESDDELAPECTSDLECPLPDGLNDCGQPVCLEGKCGWQPNLCDLGPEACGRPASYCFVDDGAARTVARCDEGVGVEPKTPIRNPIVSCGTELTAEPACGDGGCWLPPDGYFETGRLDCPSNGELEVVNGLDDDCNGEADEALACTHFIGANASTDPLVLAALVETVVESGLPARICIAANSTCAPATNSTRFVLPNVPPTATVIIDGGHAGQGAEIVCPEAKAALLIDSSLPLGGATLVLDNVDIEWKRTLELDDDATLTLVDAEIRNPSSGGSDVLINAGVGARLTILRSKIDFQITGSGGDVDTSAAIVVDGGSVLLSDNRSPAGERDACTTFGFSAPTVLRVLGGTVAVRRSALCGTPTGTLPGPTIAQTGGLLSLDDSTVTAHSSNATAALTCSGSGTGSAEALVNRSKLSVSDQGGSLNLIHAVEANSGCALVVQGELGAAGMRSLLEADGNHASAMLCNATTCSVFASDLSAHGGDAEALDLRNADARVFGCRLTADGTGLNIGIGARSSRALLNSNHVLADCGSGNRALVVDGGAPRIVNSILRAEGCASGTRSIALEVIDGTPEVHSNLLWAAALDTASGPELYALTIDCPLDPFCGGVYVNNVLSTDGGESWLVFAHDCQPAGEANVLVDDGNGADRIDFDGDEFGSDYNPILETSCYAFGWDGVPELPLSAASVVLHPDCASIGIALRAPMRDYTGRMRAAPPNVGPFAVMP